MFASSRTLNEAALNIYQQLRKIEVDVLTTFLRYKVRTGLQLDQATVRSLPAAAPDQKYVLYVHIPFCESLCPYCSFNRFLHNEDKTRSYYRALREEMRMVADLGYRFESMYIGGGTPTILVDELTQTIDLAKKLFPIKDVSSETNPNHLVPEIIQQLQGRVDRLSVGVQSFNDDLLRQMNRYNKFGSGEDIFARVQNIQNSLPAINLDMIFNFPNQTMDMLNADLDRIIASGASQVTFYPLMSAPSVANAMDRSIGRLTYAHEEEFYQQITARLAEKYVPMSAWTFSRRENAMIDEYIVEYEQYVGIGSGSFSYLDGTLFVNTFSLHEYETAIQNRRAPITRTRKFSRGEQMQYRFMMQLFDLKLDKKAFQNDYRLPIEIGLWKEMLFMQLYGAFQPGGHPMLRLRPDSYYLLVVMMREFFSGVNVLRDQARKALAPNEQLMCLVDEVQPS